MDIKEILNGSIDDAIDLLKGGKKLDADALQADWDESRHAIVVDKERYPDRSVVKEPAKKGVVCQTTGKVFDIPAKIEVQPINRLPMPIEQHITNTHTFFTVGTEPKMEFTANTDEEQRLYDTLGDLLSRNKIKYANKQIVRSWLSETEVAEYWYTVEDSRFWNGVYAKQGMNGSKPNKLLKSAIWSPFKGDKLYPVFDEFGDMKAFCRGFEKVVGEDKIECFMIITDSEIIQYEDIDGSWVVNAEASGLHGFSKIPVLYAKRNEPIWAKVRSLRERLEAIISNYADSIDYHFFPYLLLKGEVKNTVSKSKGVTINMRGDSSAEYLTWEQVPTTIELELKTILGQIYSLTNTPRIDFDSMQGFGKSLSGTAFKFTFMGIHGEVENHAEVIGEFFQRRVNFLTHALGVICTPFKTPSESIMINVDIVPYMIDDLKDRVEVAVEAVQGGVWSVEEGVKYAGNTQAVDEEVKKILGEKKIDDLIVVEEEDPSEG